MPTFACKTHNKSHNCTHLTIGVLLDELFHGLAARWQYSSKNNKKVSHHTAACVSICSSVQMRQRGKAGSTPPCSGGST